MDKLFYFDNGYVINRPYCDRSGRSFSELLFHNRLSNILRISSNNFQRPHLRKSNMYSILEIRIRSHKDLFSALRGVLLDHSLGVFLVANWALHRRRCPRAR